MAKKHKTVIDINVFDPKSIEDAIWKLEKYKGFYIERNLIILRERVAEFIKDYAQPIFDSSVADEYTEKTQERGFPSRMSTVSVSIENGNDITLVVASGQDAIFIEFGAGIHLNTPSGTSPHPWVTEEERFLFLIGEYGQGKGSYHQWALTNQIWTYGTKATMPMYHAVQALVRAFPSLVKEVFG